MEKLYPQWNGKFKTVLDSLKGRRAAVLGHLRPDGDCIGSQVALCRCLNQLDVEATAVNPDVIPGNLKPFIQDTPFTGPAAFQKEDRVALTVDCAEPGRTGDKLQEMFPDILLNVDHHISNAGFGQHNFVDTAATSTAEILAALFIDNGLPLDAATAQALYIGIATDTLQFRTGTTSGRAFRLCCRLIERGADPAAAALALYEQESIGKMRLLARFISSLRFECGGRVCAGLLPGGVFAETGAVKEDTEGLVDYARAIAGVEIGVLVEERDGAIKGSFRAKDPKHQVHRLAKQFNGGGHAAAAGFNCSGNLEDFYPRLIAALEKHLAGLDRRETPPPGGRPPGH